MLNGSIISADIGREGVEDQSSMNRINEEHKQEVFLPLQYKENYHESFQLKMKR